MPLLPDEWIQDLLSRLDIREVVERYVPLQKKGSRYWACCPFHDEKTPSFSVTPEKGIFYCYGCHKGGNAIQFVSEYEKINFREACETLAEGCGLELPSTGFSRAQQEQRQKKERILQANRAAALFFVRQLYTKAGAEALAYLRRRGLSDRDIRRNGIGYAPDDWHATGRALAKEGFDSALLCDAGLCKNGARGPYDLFRNRVMFPIINGTRRVIGFGGRVLDGSQPKYLNTPETYVFNKSRNLYHANVLGQQRDMTRILLMEGYMDVVAADRFGVSNTVATLGTALTADQARMLKRWNLPVYISYDGDNAGLTAAERATQILDSAGVSCRVIVLPDGMDPDEFLSSRGRDAFDDAVESAKEPVPFLFERMGAGLDLNRPDHKEQYLERGIEVIRAQRTEVSKERCVRMLSKATGYSEQSILRDANRETAGAQYPRVRVRRQVREELEHSSTDQKAEEILAAYVVAYPERSDWLSEHITPEDFDSSACAAVFQIVAQGSARAVSPGPAEILARIDSDEDRSCAARVLNSVEQRWDSPADADQEARSCVTRLLGRRDERTLAHLKRELAQCADEQEQVSLRREIWQLTQKIQQLQDSRKYLASLGAGQEYGR